MQEIFLGIIYENKKNNQRKITYLIILYMTTCKCCNYKTKSSHDVHIRAKAMIMDAIIDLTPKTKLLAPLSSGKLTLHSLVEQHVALQASAPDANSPLQASASLVQR